MDQIEKELEELVAKENAATESDRVEAFRGKADKRFFATISAFIGKRFCQEQGYFPSRVDYLDFDSYGYNLYNQRATQQLESDIKRLGLDYQKISGYWDKESERSFLVWNTLYTWEQFQNIMLELNKYYKQKGILIGKMVDREYQVDCWETDSLSDISYKVTEHFSSLSVVDALEKNGTILTRNIHNEDGSISPDKTKRAIVFESLQGKSCAANDEYMAGFYTRRRLLKELESEKFTVNYRAEFEQFRNKFFK